MRTSRDRESNFVTVMGNGITNQRGVQLLESGTKRYRWCITMHLSAARTASVVAHMHAAFVPTRDAEEDTA
jgi:hypothetical protein